MASAEPTGWDLGSGPQLAISNSPSGRCPLWASDFLCVQWANYVLGACGSDIPIWPRVQSSQEFELWTT